MLLHNSHRAMITWQHWFPVNAGKLLIKLLYNRVNVEVTKVTKVKFSLTFDLYPAETPIEEFAPTPAFPALQYLESVDQGGVAWRAGLRTGDFLIEVRGR